MTTTTIDMGKFIAKSVHLFLMAGAILFLSFSNSFAAGGAWQNQEFKVKGNWAVEQRADGDYIVLSDDFKTRSAPDLKLFFSKNNFSGVTGSNATQDSIFVAKLNSAKGGQAYKIPAGVNISDYQSLILHCEQYSKLWASTPLK